MNRKIVLVISLLAAALCLAACSNKENQSRQPAKLTRKLPQLRMMNLLQKAKRIPWVY